MQTAVLKAENLAIEIPVRSFDEFHGITLCCKVLNEGAVIKEFLEYHKPYVKSIMVIDGGSSDNTIEIISSMVDKVQIKKFDGHYANQMNRIMEMVETDWVLWMDCDELLEKPILDNLVNMINQEDFDCYNFPRKNYIDDVFDAEHYPDYQTRLFRSYCRWVRPVHEEVVGYKNRADVKCDDGNFIIHKKEHDRHYLRNRAYQFFELKFKHEIGKPGDQTRENYIKAYPKLSEENFRVK